ncbi:hypothetical protein OPQ81_005465 [Rhizoctonia solani]|nr:hypothetical protein OPQ81_005465 [Rhizoctonia solani]
MRLCGQNTAAQLVVYTWQETEGLLATSCNRFETDFLPQPWIPGSISFPFGYLDYSYHQVHQDRSLKMRTIVPSLPLNA